MADVSRRGILKSLSAIVAAGVGAGAFSRAVHNEITAMPIPPGAQSFSCSGCGHPVPSYANHIEIRWTKFSKVSHSLMNTQYAKATSSAFYHPKCAKKAGIKTLYGKDYGYTL